MSYNNQPEWETYKPTIKEELYECEVCDTKTKTQTKTYGCMDMEICKDCLDKEEEKLKKKKKKKKKFKIVKPSILIQEEQLLDQLVIPIKDAMALFGDDKNKKLEQCVGLDDARCSGKKIYSKTEELDLGIINMDDLMNKLTKRFVKTINSVNMSKEEKDVIDYFSGKKNAKGRKRR